MTETAATVISDALQELLVQASEQPIQSNEASDSIRYLNRMMAGWSSKGIDLGFTPIVSLGDAMTVPDGALEGIVFNLAIKIAPQYDVPVTIDLRIAAKDAYQTILRIARIRPLSKYPGTLPIGSGNEGETVFQDNHFYTDDESGILAEGPGAIIQESGNV